MTEDEVRAEIARLEGEHEALLNRMDRSNDRLAPHLAERAWRQYDQQGQRITNRLAELRAQLPPEDA